jgi:hypothetical protein
VPAFAAADPRAIYQRLAQASGDWRSPPPLVIRSEAERRQDTSGRRVAWFDTNRKQIVIDQKALGICASLGKDETNCLALLLGHELAHFYRGHSWGGDFGSRFSTLAAGQTVLLESASAAQRLIYETQADESAGLYCYLAGYDGLGAAAVAIPRIYDAYQIPPEATGYPSRSERVRIAAESAKHLALLLPVFEAGNLLFLAGQYEEAARTLDTLADQFPSPEILNNAGVAWALAAGKLFPASTHAEGYPWTLDGTSHLELTQPRAVRGGVRRPTETPEVARTRLMKLAIERFWQALLRDPDYYPAELNLVCLEHLSGRTGTATEHLAAIRPSLAARGDAAEKIARLVADAVDHGPQTGGKTGAFGAAREAETLGGAVPADLSMPKESLAFAVPVIRPGETQVLIRWRRTPQYLGLLIQLDGMSIRVLLADQASSGATRQGLHVGSAWTDLDRYPGEYRRQLLHAGSCRVYEASGAIFCTADDQHLRSWAAYELRAE